MGNAKMSAEIKYKDEEINEYKRALLQYQEENLQKTQRLQDLQDTNDRKMRQLQDELDIAQHQSSNAYAMEKQIKAYKQRLDGMADTQRQLEKEKAAKQRKCDEIEDLKHNLKIIPNLKSQIEKYKKQMIQYKVASIGNSSSNGGDKQMQQKIYNLEKKLCAVSQQNDELMINLKSARKEIINLQSAAHNESFGQNNNEMIGMSNDLQMRVSQLTTENKRLRAMQSTQHSMQQLMDELDTTTRLLKETERKMSKVQREYNECKSELESTKKSTAEWMRNSCAPQQYQNTLLQLKEAERTVNERNKYIDQIKKDMDALREEKMSCNAKLKEYEGELSRVKQRYRDLYEYTEQQKHRLGEYKKAISEMQSFDSNQKRKTNETNNYVQEIKALKERNRIVLQEMSCVQNACMNLMKRQVLMNNNMLSAKPKDKMTVDKLQKFDVNKGNKGKRQHAFMKFDHKRSQIQRPSTFAFRK